MNEENIINVPMKDQRDIATVTAEIRTLQWQGQKMVVEIAVEIGRRLCEAKSMVHHGEWQSYLKDELGFSQSTANAHMQLFREYGADQITILGATAKSQAIGNLGYTKALKLLALPGEEREEFIETHDVEGMSTRELEQAIKRLKEETARADAAEARAREAEQDKRAAEEREKLTEAREQAAKESRDAAHEALKQEKARLGAELEAAKAQFDAARAAEKKAKDKLKALKENPVVPQEMLDKLKAEAKTEADAAAAKQAEALKAERETLERQASEARKSAQDAAEQLAQVRKQLAMANPDLVEFKTRFKAAQEAVNAALDVWRRLRETDAEAAEKCAKALGALCEAIRKAGAV